MINDFVQRSDAAVMHVRSCHRDISERRRPKLAHIASLAGDVDQARIVRRVGARVAEVVQPRVVVAEALYPRIAVRRAVGEIKAAVAMKALEAFREEQHFAPLGRLADRRPVAGEISIVRRTKADDAACERADRPDHVDDSAGSLLVRERITEHPGVCGILGEKPGQGLLASAKAHLDRVVAEQRSQRLILKACRQ